MDEYTRKYLEGVPSGTSLDLQAVLEKLRESMRQQFPMARDVFRRFDTSHNGVITLTEFRQALLDEDYTTTMLASKPALDATHDPEYANRVHAKHKEREETEKVRKAVREIGDVFYKYTGKMHKVIKEFTHMTHKNFVTCEQIHEALLKTGHSFEVDNVQRCILFVIPEADLDKIDYVLFVKSLVACFHDLSACR